MLTATLGLHSHASARRKEYACAAVCQFIKGLGLKKVIVQSDGEPSICDLVKYAVARLAAEGYEITHRTSPAYDPQSNGLVESQVGQVKRMVKVLTSVINSNYEMKIGPRHYLYGWAVRHANWLMNRYVPRGVLKKSAYYANRGAEYRGQLVPFGETVMAHTLDHSC